MIRQPIILKMLMRLITLSMLAVALAACEPPQTGGGAEPLEEPPIEDPEDDASPPVEAPPALPHGAPGALQQKTARFEGSVGVTDASVVAPSMRFPVQAGPAFLNSQIFMFGGGGYDYGGGEVYANPNTGQENDPANFDYPWRDNFCEVRRSGNGLCAAGVGHQGQDIRAASCENGAFLAVAPEDGFVRRIGETHLLEIYGDSGLVYKLLHMDRPLEPGIVKDARVVKGQPLGRISNKTGAVSRSTTVHIHFEIWHGTASGGVNLGAGPLPPYSSLVEAYLDLLDGDPGQFDPVSPPADVNDCLTP